MNPTSLLQWIDLVVCCHRCGLYVVGRLAFDDLRLADTVGFMLFNEGVVCDVCLGEP